MERALLPAILLSLLLAACESTTAPATDAAAPDPGPDPAAEVPADPGTDPAPADARPDGTPPDPAADPGADAAPDAPLPDAIPPDPFGDPTPGDAVVPDPGPPDAPPADLPADTPPADVPPDACEPVACALWCEFGFATGPDGCPVCACRDCPERMPDPYECPDGTKVPVAACTPDGFAWLPAPEEACPTLCRPGAVAPLPCPDGTALDKGCACLAAPDACRPGCEFLPDGNPGWVDPCTGKALGGGPCSPGQPALCGAIGSKSEGWYGPGGLLRWTSCAPAWKCDTADACPSTRCASTMPPGTWACPDGTAVPFCGCEVPDGPCPPECRFAGTKSEGWYDACSGALVKYATCDGCTAACDAIGSKSEGWYSSCDGLIAWAMCGTGTWACAARPQDACAGHPLLCAAETGCAKGLSCVTAAGTAFPGACTKVCNPMSMGPAAQCPGGFDCVPVPEHQAPGFCLAACGDDDDCPGPLTCGGFPRGEAFPPTCFAW